MKAGYGGRTFVSIAPTCDNSSSSISPTLNHPSSRNVILMHLKLVATAAALLPIATTSCAAGPLPPLHLPSKKLEEYHKATPPLREKPELSRGEDDHTLCRKPEPHGLVVTLSGRPAQPGVNASKPVDTKPDVLPSNPSETQEASIEKTQRGSRSSSPWALRAPNLVST